jgi:catechol 2,3-dioxygenase-like lactoylglutathione lyase family enzyme
MLGSSKLVAFVPTTDVDRAQAFYCGLLDLALIEVSPYAVVVRAGDTVLRITKVDQLTPQPFTVLGWAVVDIRRSLTELAEKGVRCERFAGMDQDDAGLWTAPGGDLIAWFKDPDGNLLSFSQLSGDSHS